MATGSSAAATRRARGRRLWDVIAAGVVTGHIGDRVGRRGVLVGTLLVMGVATCAVGLREGAVEQRVRTS